VPVILGDPSQIKQVFFNILKNASEAISGNGTISVDVYATDEDVVVSFTDNGVGIPCDSAGKIFQPYFSTKGNGNGLGMMIIERIIREHNAKIDIASTYGVGTKITLSFPRKDKLLPMLK
jgi:signal transduction histidine kinase